MITIIINGQLFTINKKSILDKSHSFFMSFLKLKLIVIFGRLTLVIPPKLFLIILLESFLLNEKVKAF